MLNVVIEFSLWNFVVCYFINRTLLVPGQTALVAEELCVPPASLLARRNQRVIRVPRARSCPVSAVG